MSLHEADEDHLHTRVPVLRGSDNYKEWQRFITNRLMAKDLYDIAFNLEPLSSASGTAGPALWRKKDRQAWSLIDSSLDVNVHHNLPSHLGQIQTDNRRTFAQSALLLSHLDEQYSAVKDSRQAELYRIIWRTEIEEDEDPAPVIGSMRQAFNDLAASKVRVDDSQLAYAILLALPPSFAAIAQAFYLEDTPQSLSVISAINGEWRRRQQVGAASALQANARDARKKAPASAGRPTPPPSRFTDSKRFCEYHRSTTHWTKDCRANPNKAASNLAQVQPDSKPDDVAQTPPNFGFLAHTTVDITSHAFLAVSKTNFVLDSGASHTMVHDPSLLTGVKTLGQAIPVVIGNGSTIKATQTGKLVLGQLEIDNVLVVPSIGRNLLGVTSTLTSPSLSWKFVHNGAQLSNGTSVLLTASLASGLYTINCMPSIPSAYTVTHAESHSLLQSWHQRLGHLNAMDVIHLGKSGRLHKGEWSHTMLDGFFCHSCIQGKGQRLPSPPSSIRATAPLDLIHMDLFGP